jgi:hypothetical protein
VTAQQRWTFFPVSIPLPFLSYIPTFRSLVYGRYSLPLARALYLYSIVYDSFAIPRLISDPSSACQRLLCLPFARRSQVGLRMSRPLRLPASSTESQWLYTPAELAHSPSVRAGLTVQQELHGRARAIKRLWTLRNYQTVSVPLRRASFPAQRADCDGATQRHQPVISTAATFLHRFYMRETMQQYDPVVNYDPMSTRMRARKADSSRSECRTNRNQTAAVAAFFLACKSEEEPRSIKALVQFLLEATRDQRRFRVDRIAAPQTDLPEFQKLRAKVLTYEEAILRSLCYDLTVRNPHWYAVNTAKQVWTGGDETETGKRVAQVAWTFLNDS